MAIGRGRLKRIGGWIDFRAVRISAILALCPQEERLDVPINNYQDL